MLTWWSNIFRCELRNPITDNLVHEGWSSWVSFKCAEKYLICLPNTTCLSSLFFAFMEQWSLGECKSIVLFHIHFTLLAISTVFHMFLDQAKIRPFWIWFLFWFIDHPIGKIKINLLIHFSFLNLVFSVWDQAKFSDWSKIISLTKVQYICLVTISFSGELQTLDLWLSTRVRLPLRFRHYFGSFFPVDFGVFENPRLWLLYSL